MLTIEVSGFRVVALCKDILCGVRTNVRLSYGLWEGFLQSGVPDACARVFVRLTSQKLAQCRVELTVLAVVVCGVSSLVRVLPLLVEGWISAERKDPQKRNMNRKPKLQTLVTRTT